MTPVEDRIVPLAELDKIEKLTPHMHLIAVTHGDPSDEKMCGRPVSYRKTRENEKRSADLVAVCPVHGDLAYRGIDMRPRRKLE